MEVFAYNGGVWVSIAASALALLVVVHHRLRGAADPAVAKRRAHLLIAIGIVAGLVSAVPHWLLRHGKDSAEPLGLLGYYQMHPINYLVDALLIAAIVAAVMILRK